MPDYQITGPDDDGFIWLHMPSISGVGTTDFNLGTDKEAIAEAMSQWLGSIDQDEITDSA